MDSNKIKKLLELIEEIVNVEGLTWNEKKSEIIAQCDGENSMALNEFCAWFEEEPDDEEDDAA